MKEMSNQLHSYNFDAFTDNGRTEELKRLHKQATLAQDYEIKFVKKLALASNTNALEVGCGPGFITALIADVFSAGETIGIDSSKELLNVANTSIKPVHKNLSFIEGDAYNLPFENNRFDLVYNRMLYQHLNKPLKALSEAKRVTKTGGKVCILDIDAGSQFIEPSCIAFDKLNEMACIAQKKYGGDRYIGRKLPQLMQEIGFSKIEFNNICISSLDLGIEDYLNITTKFKAMMIGTPEANDLINEVIQFCKSHKYPPFIFVNVFVGIGTV